MGIKLSIKRLAHADGLPTPSYATTTSSGLDLAAAVVKTITLGPGERILVPTGFQMEIPLGYEGQVRPRSGLALKHGISMVNTPGTIDSDYRGEVMIIMINHGSEPFVINRGDRIAQLVIAPVIQAEVIEVDDLNQTERGTGGFGHTGS